MYLLYCDPVDALSCLVAAITILSWIPSPFTLRPISLALGTFISPLTKSTCSGFCIFLAALAPVGGLGSTSFISSSLAWRTFSSDFLQVLLAMSRAPFWTACFLPGFDVTSSTC